MKVEIRKADKPFSISQLVVIDTTKEEKAGKMRNSAEYIIAKRNLLSVLRKWKSVYYYFYKYIL